MSLVGKAARALSNQTPVPMGGTSGSSLGMAGLGLGLNDDLTLIRAYKRNGTAFANVSLLASSTAAPEWSLYRTQPIDGRRRYTTNDEGSDQRQQVVNHAALNLLNNPAQINVGSVKLPAWTRFTLFEISQTWLDLTGKSFWILDYAEGRSPVPLGIWPVRPDRITPIPDPDNWLKGWLYTSPDGREKIPLLPTEVIRNNYPDPEDPYGGTGPIQSVLDDVEAADYAAQWNKNFFINSAEPGGVISTTGDLDEEEFNELVDRWRETHRGVARAHRIAVLENGATWTPNPHSLKDMDFANLRGTSRDIIRESLGMHKVMTGVTDDVNRANAQTGEEVFGSWKISPRLKRWRNVLNHQYLPLFGATGQAVEFDFALPMPQNREQDNIELTTKTQAALALVTAGYEPADVLEAVGLPEMGVAEKASGQPATPPGWEPGTPGGGAPDSGQAADLEAAVRNVMQRQTAAWNRLAAGV